ncbi:MAG: phosphatase PAP2 family protein [Clostridia bacterium]|nr:phosphatase PAP2 family protein [Clostridia bacterium]
MKRKIICISSISIIFLSLIIIATFYDFAISKSLAEVKGLDILVTIGGYGKLPAFVGIFVGSALIYTGLNDRIYNSIALIIIKIINICLIVVGLFLVLYYIIPSKLVGLIISVLAIVPIIGLLERYKDKLKFLFYFGLFVFIAILLSIVVLLLLKNIICRSRFYIMYEANDYTLYSAWYQNLYNMFSSAELLLHNLSGASSMGVDAYMSFPSGHAGMTAALLILNVLPSYIERLKKYRWLILVVTVLLTAFVCFSRMLALMHYLSDVVFGVLITVLSMVVSHIIVSLIKKRVFKDC